LLTGWIRLAVRKGVQIGVEAVRKHETVVAFAILIAIALVIGLGFMKTPRPEADAIRYIAYAVNLHDHGVFSRESVGSEMPPTPGSGHAPLYPAWVAAFAGLDEGIRDTLACLVQNSRGSAPCSLDLRLVVATQLVLAGIFLGCVWSIASRLSGNSLIAWLAAFCALLARSPIHYANQILTEALLLPLLGLLLLFLTVAYQRGQARWMLAAGVTLGLAALTRPAYAYLFYAMTVVLALAAAVRWRRTLLLSCILFAVAYGCVVTPWLARNKLQVDRLALTTGYDGDILAQRIAYNRMTWREFGLAFLLWFPDIGDNMAKLAAPKKDFIRLTWDPGSYYKTLAPQLYQDTVKKAGHPDSVVGYLIRNEILAHPVKHTLVSLPLAFRAVFVSKYWGVAGLICFIVLVFRQIRKRDYALLMLSLPVWFMVAFHAFVSVSIPRYNIALIPFYAYAMAWALRAAGCYARSFLHRRAPAI
jgi:4-amino-4-deoxy-L-arabinose transferase-like glycosyltransferase